ncbi:uncharacterized protein ACNLHF_020169 isoform 1-T3 [Anomaloglossus baeobatrachus]
MAVNSLLDAKSSHPFQVINSIPTGQFLRARRVCSSDSSFENQSFDLRRRFRARHYSSQSIQKGYERAKRTPRAELLKVKDKTTDDTLRLITPYHAQWREMSAIITKYWPILMPDHDLAPILTLKPAITPRRSRTLRDLIVRSHYTPHSISNPFTTLGPRCGSFSCGYCGACPQMDRAFQFWDSSRSKTYKILQFINCRSMNVVYWASCPYGLIYVGLTTRALRVRVLEHLRDIKNAAKAQRPDEIAQLKNIPRHFRERHGCNWRQLKFRGIDRVNLGIRGGDITNVLHKKEALWITILDTIKPRGLNDAVSFKPFLK